MKVKSLTLSYPHQRTSDAAIKKFCQVERVGDTVEYSPSQLLDRNTVESLCANNAWRITIVPVKP